MSPPATHDQRILVVRTDRLGDVLLTLPMFSRLRAHFPQAYLVFLVRRYTSEIVEGHPHIDRLLLYDDPSGVPVPFETMRSRLVDERFDTVVVASPTPRLAWLVFRAGISMRVGTGYRYYSALFNRRVLEHRRRGDKHELECNLALLTAIGCPPEVEPGPVEFHLKILPEVRESALSKLEALGIRNGEPRVVLHPGTGGSSRDWPVERFGILARELGKKGMQVVITGSSSEQELVARATEASGGTARPAAGLFSLKELAAVFQSSRLFAGNSSGPIHLAVAVGTPVVGLYPQLPAIGARRWGPYTNRARVIVPDKPATCRDCRNSRECACMASISVDRVLAEATGLLEQHPLTGREERP